MRQRIRCGTTIVSTDFSPRLLVAAVMRELPGEKIVHLDLDSCINLSGLIWTSVIRLGSTNHRRPVLNLALKKIFLQVARVVRGVGERDRREIEKERNFILDIYPTLQILAPTVTELKIRDAHDGSVSFLQQDILTI